MAIDKCPRLETQVIALNVGLQNMRNQLQAERHAMHQARAKIDELDRDLKNALAIRDLVEKDVACMNGEKESLEAALKSENERLKSENERLNDCRVSALSRKEGAKSWRPHSWLIYLVI